MKRIITIFLIIAPLRMYGQCYMDIITNQLFQFNPNCIANKIAYPVNHGYMNGYYDAKPFQTYSNVFHSRHQGADINGNAGGNSDLGDTIYSIAVGKVICVSTVINEEGKYASIIMILHKTKKEYIVSLYRHCQKSFVKLGDYVDYLQPISTIGNDFGLWLSHLHFEIRTNPYLDIGCGYGDPAGYVDPMKFIKEYNK
jgi:murein DD-endopeptidase MepM/ murein hydrolase activator NlpD